VISLVAERRQAMRRFWLPNPALAIALAALVVALSGTAFAAGEAVVPLAKCSRPLIPARSS
jgi:hypothetical protein